MAHGFTRTPENAFTALRQFARLDAAVEHCEMCNREIAEEHEHLVEPAHRKLICACTACAILFSTPDGRKFKRVPRRVVNLQDFHLSDAQWDGLMVPIDMAFFFKSSAHDRVVALYPSPAGPTESLLSLEAWGDIAAVNPVLDMMEPDVMALLVNRVGHSRGSAPPVYFLVPIDESYKLVGIIRTHWRGLSGGGEVWHKVETFFAALKNRALRYEEVPHA